jgi:hypothetical protein
VHSPTPAKPRDLGRAPTCERDAAPRCAQTCPSGCNRATARYQRQARRSARRGS